MKAKLFCDIDGVVNVAKQSHTNLVETPFSMLEGLPKFFNYKTFRHRPEVAEFLKQVDAELVWLTAWQKFAPVALDKLFNLESKGFLPWKHNLLRACVDRKHFQKSVALNQWVESNPNVPFVWVDDYATMFADRYSFSRRDDVLIIKTDSSEGLTDSHMSRIQKFLHYDF